MISLLEKLLNKDNLAHKIKSQFVFLGVRLSSLRSII